jgi:uncharacterized NAD(P)/FAD-binding protein YdhS
LLDDRRLQVSAGRILALENVDSLIRVSIRPRGADTAEVVKVGTVVNCTGPSSDVRTLRDPLIDYLRSRAMVQSDPLGLGLMTAGDGALLDSAGKPSRFIYYVGPLLKALHWEATAVPELRVHATRLADWLIESLNLRRL